MEDLVVGDKDCSINAILDCMTESESFLELAYAWNELGILLHIDLKMHHRINRSVMQNAMEIDYALMQVLFRWKKIQRRDAKLIDLIEALKIMNHYNIADLLEIRFAQAQNIDVTSKLFDLDDKGQPYILNIMVNFFGTLRPLHEILQKLPTDTRDAFIAQYINKKSLPDNLKFENEVLLACDTTPKSLEYYVERTLIYCSRMPKRKVDSALFSKLANDRNAKDILLVKNISWKDLSKLANDCNEGTDRSSSQLEKITSRFILLECDRHFDRILNSVGDRPVHLINKIGDSFYLEKSHGSSLDINDLITEQFETITEMDFVRSLGRHTCEPVCISDTPGMGKSFLLASIARRMSIKYPSRIVMFIEIRDFFQNYLKGTVQMTEEDFIRMLIASNATNSVFGQELVFEILKNPHNQIELFFDGYDEIQSEEIGIAKYLLRFILDNFQNTRLFLTTRPHKKDEVEDFLGVKSYNILPFQYPDQVDFLCKYWQHKKGAQPRNIEDFKPFAQLCINELKANMNDFEREIAGIPLQCMLLGEVYFEDAIGYSQSKPEYGLNFQITSFASMFKELMQMRFKGSNDIQQIKNLHVFYAVQLLFPEWLSKFKKILTNNINFDDNSAEIFSFGIMEAYKFSRRFVHRTFAEYLLAEFLMTSLKNSTFKNDETQLVLRFLLETILQTNQCKDSILENTHNVSKTNSFYGEIDSSYKFKHPVICYFVDSCFGHVHNKIKVSNTCGKLLQKTYHEILVSCSYHNYSNVVSMIEHLNDHVSFYFVVYKYSRYLRRQSVDEQMAQAFIIAARHSSTDLVKKLCKVSKNFYYRSMTSLEFPKSYNSLFFITPLHVAIQSGNFRSVEFFLKEFGAQVKGFKCLLHVCVENSAADSDGVINCKKEIIDRIVDDKKDVLDERTELNGRTPLLMDNIHFELIKHLVHNNANLTSVTGHFSNFVHKAVGYVSAKEYSELVKIVIGKGEEKLLWTCDVANMTPIELGLKKHVLEEEVIDLLLEWVKQLTYTELIVGDEDCSINDVVCVLIDTPVREILVTSLRELTLRLNTDAVLVEKLRKDELLDKQTYVDTIVKILVEWRKENGLKASLETLIKTIRKCKWNDMADSLERVFQRTKEKTLLAAIQRVKVRRK